MCPRSLGFTYVFPTSFSTPSRLRVNLRYHLPYGLMTDTLVYPFPSRFIPISNTILPSHHLRGYVGQRVIQRRLGPLYVRVEGDRKSTRLNSSHQIISYAVFCLKKKK